MAVRDIAMTTAKVAAEVFASSRAMERIEQDGYTRIDPFRIAAGEGVSVLPRHGKAARRIHARGHSWDFG